MERPTIDNTQAVFQAGDTISTYLSQAVEMIDRRFGKGYAAEHPALVAECIHSQALDYNSTALTAALYQLADGIQAREPFFAEAD